MKLQLLLKAKSYNRKQISGCGRNGPPCFPRPTAPAVVHVLPLQYYTTCTSTVLSLGPPAPPRSIAGYILTPTTQMKPVSPALPILLCHAGQIQSRLHRFAHAWDWRWDDVLACTGSWISMPCMTSLNQGTTGTQSRVCHTCQLHAFELQDSEADRLTSL